MNIIIVGCGKVGDAIAEQLSKADHNIVVVDSDSKVVKNAVDAYDVKGLCGNGANFDVQKDAQVENCDLLISCTSSDELNILCCMVAKKLGAADTIARIRNPEYFKLFMERELGLSLMVNPDYEAAMEIFRILRFPTAIKVEPFADGKVELIELKIAEDNPLVGVSLTNFYSKFQTKLLICTIQRDDSVLIPNGNTIIQSGDKINLTASPKDVYALFKKLKLLKSNIKKVMIIGGSRISYYLALELRKLGMSIKIIESDEKKCLSLSEELDRVEIIHGDGSDQNVLMEEGLATTDALIALTGVDEQNIIISLFASSKNVDKVITKINRNTYCNMLENSGVESIISPKSLTANQITRYVRGKENSQGGMCTLYRIANDAAEALEFVAGASFPQLSVPLKSLELKKNVLIACILRKGVVITPNGNDTLEENDRVIVITTEQNFDGLEDILA